MKPLAFLQEHADLLTLVLDPEQSQDVKSRIEKWSKGVGINLISPDQVAHSTGMKVHVLTAESLASNRKTKGRTLFVRPLHRDLLKQDATTLAESKADAVVDIDEGIEAFQMVLVAWLTAFMEDGALDLEKECERRQRGLEREVREALSALQADEEGHKRLLSLFQSFLDLQEKLSGESTWQALAADLEELTRKLDKKRAWKLLRPGSQWDNRQEGELHFLGRFHRLPVFAINTPKDHTPSGVIASQLVVHGLRTRLARIPDEGEDYRPGQLVQEAFRVLPFPTLLLGASGELLQHNTAFVKLNVPPSHVTRLQEGDQLETREGMWGTVRTDIAGENSLRTMYTFFPPQGDGSDWGGQELGIITSSIAHELNNPLAGLLAALDVMSLEEGWDTEDRERLSEMKQGAVRCKQLVETFLGFSRPTSQTLPYAGGKDVLRACFEQALHLLRFRMVESGLRIQMSIVQEHPFAYPVHAPSITMALYLTLGDLMTAFHHLKLLERESARGLSLEVEIREGADQFRLIFQEVLPKSTGGGSKLLTYLLQQERLSLTFGLKDITFIHQNVLI